jgi:lipopolysaccharide/colanic/teichoic acid biosynthesis glycosyltransferase
MIDKITHKNFILYKKTNFDKTLQGLKDGKRFLKVGLFSRRFSIDELCQFINILNGNMSIIERRPRMVGQYIYYSSLL